MIWHQQLPPSLDIGLAARQLVDEESPRRPVADQDDVGQRPQRAEDPLVAGEPSPALRPSTAIDPSSEAMKSIRSERPGGNR